MSWRFLDKSCQVFAFSGPKSQKFKVSIQELPKFDLALTKISKKHILPQTKIAKKYTNGETRCPKKYTLADGTSPDDLYYDFDFFVVVRWSAVGDTSSQVQRLYSKAAQRNFV